MGPRGSLRSCSSFLLYFSATLSILFSFSLSSPSLVSFILLLSSFLSVYVYNSSLSYCPFSLCFLLSFSLLTFLLFLTVSVSILFTFLIPSSLSPYLYFSSSLSSCISSVISSSFFPSLCVSPLIQLAAGQTCDKLPCILLNCAEQWQGNHQYVAWQPGNSADVTHCFVTG